MRVVTAVVITMLLIGVVMTTFPPSLMSVFLLGVIFGAGGAGVVYEGFR